MSGEQVLGLLRALCAGLSTTPITVVAHDRATAFVPSENRILVSRRFLEADTLVAIGALLHEIGHVLVSRYDRFAAPAGAPEELWPEALNACEESRIHHYLRQRLPGVRPYLQALFAMDDVPDASHFESDLVAFLAATATWDRYPSLPFLKSLPVAAAAFESTAEARWRYTTTLPSASLSAGADVAMRYDQEVVSMLRAPDAVAITPLEAEIRCAAAASLRVFLDGIWPTIEELLARDQSRIARGLTRNDRLRAKASAGQDESAEAELARRILRTTLASASDLPTKGPSAEVDRLAASLMRSYLKQQAAARRSPQPARDEMPPFLSRRTDGLDDDFIELDESSFSSGTHDGDDNSAPPVRLVQSALVDVLRAAVPRRPAQWESGHQSGKRVDLRRVMRASASGRDTDRIWSRRSAERSALAALLLVDLSGSMSGRKIAAAIDATSALSQALAEISGVSWCVMGFQDRLIPVIDFDERAGPAALARIAAMRQEVAGDRPGGNNRPSYNDDGPCLLEAADALMARPQRDRLLMVISDGNPEGCRSTRGDLHKAVAQVQTMPGMTLVGLGLGPGTDHVTRYYPQARASVDIDDLAPVIGRLLAAELRMAGV